MSLNFAVGTDLMDLTHSSAVRLFCGGTVISASRLRNGCAHCRDPVEQTWNARMFKSACCASLCASVRARIAPRPVRASSIQKHVDEYSPSRTSEEAECPDVGPIQAYELITGLPIGPMKLQTNISVCEIL